MKGIILLAFIYFFTFSAQAKQIEIKGRAEGGAGKTIEVLSYNDPVLLRSRPIKSIVVSDDDSFSFKLSYDETGWIKLRYGIYELGLIIEPGGSYYLELPEYKDLPGSENLIPLVKYRYLHLKLKGEDNLNNRIRMIDSLFFNYASGFTRSISLGEPVSDRDSILNIFNRIELATEDEYSQRYHKFRKCLLKMIADRGSRFDASEMEIINNGFYPHMPAYTDLVTQVFNGYLRNLAFEDETKRLRALLNRGGSYTEISAILRQDGLILNESLLEFVIIYNLFNEYYNSGFNKSSLEKILLDISDHAVNDYNKDLSRTIVERINRLKPGNRPPDFNLPDDKGNVFSLDSLEGKFTILAFGSSVLYETKKELDVLKSWVKDYEDYLELVVILLDEDYESSLTEMKSAGYDFIFLDASGRKEILKDYDIRYIPSFYLLDKQARLIQSPAVFPSENLKRSVLILLEKSLIEDIRN